MDQLSNAFVAADYIVFGATFLMSLMIGIYFAFRSSGHTSMDDFLLARRKMKPLPVALSLMVTYNSSIFVLGYPAEVYMYIHGFVFWMLNVGTVLGILLFMTIPIKLFHPLNFESVYEYLALRYQVKKVRVLAVSLASLSLTLYSGLVLLGPALALGSVTDIPEWATVVSFGSLAVPLYIPIPPVL